MQTSDRAHWIGQEKPVFIYKLIAHDAVVEKNLQLQEKKRALVKSRVTTEAGFIKSLSPADRFVNNLGWPPWPLGQSQTTPRARAG